MRVGIIILAAGASSRMGEPKQLLSYRGRSLIRNVAETALATDCRPVIVVVGAYAENLHREIKDLPLHVVVNATWTKGMGSSISTGLETLQTIQENADAVMLMLCDQPFISADIINNLVAAYEKTGQLIVASGYEGAMGVPAVFSKRLFPTLLALKGADGAKQLIKRHYKEVVRVSVPEGAFDIDTPEDVERLRSPLKFDS